MSCIKNISKLFMDIFLYSQPKELGDVTCSLLQSQKWGKKINVLSLKKLSFALYLNPFLEHCNF